MDMFEIQKKRLINAMNNCPNQSEIKETQDGVAVHFDGNGKQHDCFFKRGCAQHIGYMRDLTNMFNNSTPKGAA